MHIMYCCCRRRNMTAMTQSVAVHSESRLTDATDRTTFSMQVFRPLSTFVASFPELPSTSTHGYVVQQSINSFQRWNFVEATDTEMVEEGFHCSSAPAFAELVWSKHCTDLDL